MTAEEIIKKAKKSRRIEKKLAPFMILLGLLFLGLLIYVAYDLKEPFSKYADLFDVKTICEGDETEAEEYLKTIIMFTGLISFVLLSVLHSAIALISKGIDFAQGDEERELLIELFEKNSK